MNTYCIPSKLTVENIFYPFQTNRWKHILSSYGFLSVEIIKYTADQSFFPPSASFWKQNQTRVDQFELDLQNKLSDVLIFHKYCQMYIGKIYWATIYIHCTMYSKQMHIERRSFCIGVFISKLGLYIYQFYIIRVYVDKMLWNINYTYIKSRSAI